MARELGQVSYNTFVKGLITEAGPLTFPENASIEDVNCILTVKGSHKRRYGLQQEADGTPMDFTVNREEFKRFNMNSYTWRSPGNKGSKTFLVMQVCTELHFYDISERGTIVYNTASLTVDLNSFIVDLTLFKENGCSFTSGKGYLFVTGRGLDPFYVEYNVDTDRLSCYPLNLLIRDAEGVKDGLGLTDQPTELSKEHLYNLLNQGWVYSEHDELIEVTSPLTALFTQPDDWDGFRTKWNEFTWILNGKVLYSDYVNDDNDISDLSVNNQRTARSFNKIPASTRQYLEAVAIEGSGVQIRSTSKTPESLAGASLTMQLRYVTNGGSKTRYKVETRVLQLNQDVTESIEGAPYDVYHEKYGRYPSNVQQWFVGREVKKRINVEEVYSFDFGTQRAPRGRLLINPFIEDRSRYIKSIPNKVDNTRVIDTAFLGGRVFYLRTNQLLYSQVLTDISKASLCYQDGDPTSEESFDIVDSDGGVIAINDMGEGVALFELQNGLLVFASNGVWAVTGLSPDEGFKATSYSVRKLSSVDCISKKSIVNVGGAPIFWSSTGIYTVQTNDFGNYGVQSLSSNTIQTLYKDIPLSCLKRVVGCYDEGAQKAFWLYDDDTTDTDVLVRTVKALIFDTRLGAFYEYHIAHGSSNETPFLCGMFNTPWLTSVEYTEEITDNDGNIVEDNFGEVVYIKTSLLNSDLTNLKFIAYENLETYTIFTLADFTDLSFTDWSTSLRQGVPYDSYFTTGFNIAGDSSRTKDINYLTVQLTRTEDNYLETEIGNLSSCLLQTRWGFENTALSNRWTKWQQLYRAPRIFAATLDDPSYDRLGMPVVTTKHKIRGNGKAIQMKFMSEPGKNFEVLGWSMILGARQQ